jgi:excisionase family DNA binding protein
VRNLVVRLQEVVTMSSTSPRRLVSTSTVPFRARVRKVEQPVINITLQTDDRKVLTVADAAQCLGISRSLLDKFIAAGEIRTIHIGRLCKVPVGVLDEFIASRPTGRPTLS